MQLVVTARTGREVPASLLLPANVRSPRILRRLCYDAKNVLRGNPVSPTETVSAVDFFYNNGFQVALAENCPLTYITEAQ
jgi:hypothetical protein